MTIFGDSCFKSAIKRWLYQSKAENEALKQLAGDIIVHTRNRFNEPIQLVNKIVVFTNKCNMYPK